MNSRQLKSDWNDFAAAAFGGLGAGLLPWQKVAMDQQAILGAQAGVYGRGIAEEAMQRMERLRRDLIAMGQQRLFVQPRRPKPVYGYWQFKNGKLAELSGPRDLPYDMDWYCVWDRSLGADVCYATR